MKLTINYHPQISGPPFSWRAWVG